MAHFRPKPVRLAILLLLTAAAATGCARTPAISYYQLSAAGDQPVLQPAASTEAVIGIGPVRLREHLDQPQIVTRPEPNRIRLATDHRWAEQLSDNISWVVRENLAALLGTGNFLLHPWPHSAKIDLQLRLDVLQFEGTADNDALLSVLWQIVGPDGEPLLDRQKSSYRVEASSDEYGDLVAALSEALARFSRDVARDMEKLLTQN